MSKIKDLYAIENGIDDLMPVDDPVEKANNIVDKLEKYYEPIKALINKHMEDIKYDIAYEAEFSSGVDDEGHEEIYFDNFFDLCHTKANAYVDEYIEEQHLDLNDAEYTMLWEWSGNWLADILADYESMIINDYIEDNKTRIDELKERNGEC